MITITAAVDDRLKAKTPGGTVEASSLRELGDRLRNLVAKLLDESDGSVVELSSADLCPRQQPVHRSLNADWRQYELSDDPSVHGAFPKP